MALSALPARVGFLALALARSPDASYDRSLDRLAMEIEARPENRALAERVARRRRLLSSATPRPRIALRGEIERAGLAVVRVPGLLYETYPESGADLAALDHWLGGDTGFVATRARDGRGGRGSAGARAARRAPARTPRAPDFGQSCSSSAIA